MNSPHSNMQFTCEEELNDKILLLDIPITRSNNKLVTSLYRKKTFSGAYMNYNSFFTNKLQEGFNQYIVIPILKYMC